MQKGLQCIIPYAGKMLVKSKCCMWFALRQIYPDVVLLHNMQGSYGCLNFNDVFSRSEMCLDFSLSA